MRADQLPIPRVNPAPAWLDDYHTNTNSPQHISAYGIQSGDLIWSSAMNRNAAHLDVLSISGCGSIGVVNGLTPTMNTGLAVEVSAGTALIGGVVQKTTSTIVSLYPSSTNFIWINRAGAFVVQSTTSAPSGECCFLGTATTNANSVTDINSYGVVHIRSGIATRTTTDENKPTDTPPANWRGFTKTATYTWFWDGARYVRLDENDRPRQFSFLAKTLPDSNYTLTEGEYQHVLLVFSGSLTAGRDVVLPLQAGRTHFVRNQTGQTLTVKASTGSGVSISAGKSAVVFCDGTDYVRLTTDA